MLFSQNENNKYYFSLKNENTNGHKGGKNDTFRNPAKQSSVEFLHSTPYTHIPTLFTKE